MSLEMKFVGSLHPCRPNHPPLTSFPHPYSDFAHLCSRNSLPGSQISPSLRVPSQPSSRLLLLLPCSRNLRLTLTIPQAIVLFLISTIFLKLSNVYFFLDYTRTSPHPQTSITFNLPIDLIILLRLPFFTLDNIFSSADRSQPTLLVSLDLSAAFDTIDRSTLLSRLSTSFGVNGTALAWLTSYLTNRTQTVCMGSVSSDSSCCVSGVPHGSVLGPLLFSLYISPVGQIVSDHGISHQQYADDAQLYIGLRRSDTTKSVDRLEACLSALRSWLCFNGLCLNPDKSEAILFGTHQSLRTFATISSIKIADDEINISNQITSLGVIMDSTLTFNHHVTALCKACHFHLRSLRHIRRSPTDDMAVSIAVALVQSRLDFCNSLLFGISAFNLNKLQRVQNLAARLALNDWTTPHEKYTSFKITLAPCSF